jgi:hypothetical protein
MAEKRVTTVAMLEVADGDLITGKEFLNSPDRAELAAQATAVLKAELKGVIAGKSPVFGRDLILALVMAVMEEDFDADGPQTIAYDDYEDAEGMRGCGVPAEAAAPFRKSRGRAL